MHITDRPFYLKAQKTVLGLGTLAVLQAGVAIGALAATPDVYESPEGVFLARVVSFGNVSADAPPAPTSCIPCAAPAGQPLAFSANVTLTNGRVIVLRNIPRTAPLYLLTPQLASVRPNQPAVDVRSYLAMLPILGYDANMQILLLAGLKTSGLEGVVWRIDTSSESAWAIRQEEPPSEALSRFPLTLLARMAGTVHEDDEQSLLNRYMLAEGAPRGITAKTIKSWITPRDVSPEQHMTYPEGSIYNGLLLSTGHSTLTLESWKKKLSFRLSSSDASPTLLFHVQRTEGGAKRVPISELAKVKPGTWVQVVANHKTRQAYRITVYTSGLSQP